MSLPPLPWSYETNAPSGKHEGNGFVYLVDATGRKIGTVWGRPAEKMATIQLIIDASQAPQRSNHGEESSEKVGGAEKVPETT